MIGKCNIQIHRLHSIYLNIIIIIKQLCWITKLSNTKRTYFLTGKKHEKILYVIMENVNQKNTILNLKLAKIFGLYQMLDPRTHKIPGHTI